MNIFVVDANPYVAAEWLWDRDFKRANKMILESTQMLCTALNVWHGKQVTPYKSTHINHPCNIWVRETFDNWFWLYKYADYMCHLFKGKDNKTHRCYYILKEIFPLDKITRYGLKPFANCARNTKLGLDFTHLPVTEAYQQYLQAKWSLEGRPPSI